MDMDGNEETSNGRMKPLHTLNENIQKLNWKKLHF